MERGQLQAREHIRRERRADDIDGCRGAEDKADGELGVVLEGGKRLVDVVLVQYVPQYTACDQSQQHPPGSPTMHRFFNIWHA